MNKIAIVNRTNLKNYGSVLQCLALCTAINQMGYDTVIVWEQGNISKNFDLRPVKLIKTAWKVLTHPYLLKMLLKTVSEIQKKEVDLDTVALFERFVAKQIHQEKLTLRQLSSIAAGNKYLKFVCGSDQVWCSTTTYVDPLMYLRFAPANKRVAYAPSLGRDHIPSYNRRQMRKYINEIPCVSVRETDGQKLIKELTGRDVPVVLDPTLLLDRSLWDDLMPKATEAQGKYMLCYFLNTPSESTQRSIASFFKPSGCKVIALGCKLPWLSEHMDVFYPSSGPAEFLYYIAHADVVVTDSYHGMLFSIIYHKNFWSVERSYQQYDQSTRQLSLLNLLEIQNRYLPCDQIAFSDASIEYETVDRLLESMRKESVRYLKDSLDKIN